MYHFTISFLQFVNKKEGVGCDATNLHEMCVLLTIAIKCDTWYQPVAFAHGQWDKFYYTDSV